MKHRKTLIISALYLVLSGIIVAFFANLLVYFKQKEVLHLSIILALTLIISLSAHLLRTRLPFSSTFRTFCMATLVLISWFGPQFLYQIRPYTFYISGIVVVGILIACVTANVFCDQKTLRFPWKLVVFLISFFVAYIVPWDYLQYIILALSMLLAGIFLFDVNIKSKMVLSAIFVFVIIGHWHYSVPLQYYEEQENYEDKVLFSANTQFHKLVITQWQDDYWIFKDKLKNLSSIDDFLFYEPMAHSIFKVGNEIQDVLVIGGENGCLMREILKHNEVVQIDIISYDTLLRNIGKNEMFYVQMNQGAYEHQKVSIISEELIEYLSGTRKRYDAIFIDLPDPRSVETNQYYTREFYLLIKNLLLGNGIMITQAGSPYFATDAYLSIGKTIKSVGFHILPIHNQILTLGEWGWYISSSVLTAETMKNRLVSELQDQIETEWFNGEAAKLVSSFGKLVGDSISSGINTLDNPLVYQYYLKGTWELN